MRSLTILHIGMVHKSEVLKPILESKDTRNPRQTFSLNFPSSI
jgi:hypothetical protein